MVPDCRAADSSPLAIAIRCAGAVVMTRVICGTVARPKPRPMKVSPTPTPIGASPPIRASSTPPTRVSTIATTRTRRGPSRALTRPATSGMKVIGNAEGRKHSPVATGPYPCTCWRNTLMEKTSP